MKEEKLNRIIYGLMIFGLILIATGVGLATFTNWFSGGEFMYLALMIALGLLLVAPSKMYLTFQMMRRNDEKLRKEHEALSDQDAGA